MVRIAIISDLHLGFGRGMEREEDPFVAAERAFEKVEDEDVDMIVLAGDIFDSRLPRPEHWSRFMRLLSEMKNGRSVEISRTKGREEVPEESIRGLPVLAIHGTHERRANGMKNSIEALEDAGFLVHMHCSSVELNIDGEKVGVHGMSGVPEKYSKGVLKKWGPEPFEDAYNIFMLHQDLEQYIYNPASPPELGLEDLPGGFDLYVSGHIHCKNKEAVKDGHFIIPGSLIPTQQRRKEFETPKGFYVAETETNKVQFIEIDPPRKLVYEKIDAGGSNPKEIKDSITAKIEKLLQGGFENKPLIRIKLTGELDSGLNPGDIDLSKIREKYKNDAIITVLKDLDEEGMEGAEKIKTHEDRMLSVEEIGMRILRKNLEGNGSGISPEPIFEDLVEGNLNSALKKLKEGHNKDEEKEKTKTGEWWKGY